YDAPPCSAFLPFSATAPARLHTLSLHDALPISTIRRASRSTWCKENASSRAIAARSRASHSKGFRRCLPGWRASRSRSTWTKMRSEEHTSELQSRENLVCRLLLEKKKHIKTHYA